MTSVTGADKELIRRRLLKLGADRAWVMNPKRTRAELMAALVRTGALGGS